MSLISQLNDVYYNEEDWCENRLPIEEITRYHNKVMSDGNLVCVEIAGELLGYVEVWRITFEQFGRIICGEKCNPYTDNVTDGNIAYVANVWVKKEARRGKVIKVLKYLFYALNHHCDYYVGEARRKRTGLVKVFKKDELKSRIFTSGVNDG